MKVSTIFAVIVCFLVLIIAPALAQVNGLPDSGTYFIVNVSSDEALQPVGASIGQNVFLYEFNKAGAQQWTIVRKIDAKTKTPTNRYTIRLAGENTGLHFQPHPSVDSSAIISIDPSVFVLEKGDAGILVKSVTKNGDALYIYPSPPGNTETRFGPNDGSAKFRWKFVPAN